MPFGISSDLDITGVLTEIVSSKLMAEQMTGFTLESDAHKGGWPIICHALIASTG